MKLIIFSREFTGAILEMVNPCAGKSETSSFKKPLAPGEDTSPQGKLISPKFKKELIRKVIYLFLITMLFVYFLL